MKVPGGQLWFLTGDMVDRFILDVMDDLLWPKERYPESFVFISLFEVCQEWGVLDGGTSRTLMVPDRIHEGQGHPWCHGWPFWPKGRYPEMFMLISLLEVCQEWGVLHGDTWRMLRVPDRRLGRQGHSWFHGWPGLPLRKILWKFCVDIFIRSVSRMGGPSCGYLEDVEGSWQETWRTRSSLMSWRTMFDPKEDTLKVSCQYLH